MTYQSGGCSRTCVPAIGLLCLFVASCANACEPDAPSIPSPEFTLETTPSVIEVVIGQETESPIEFVSTVQDSSDDLAWTTMDVSLRFESSDSDVVTLPSPSGLVPTLLSLRDYPTGRSGYDCPVGDACFNPLSADGTLSLGMGLLYVQCHRADTAIITISGTLEVRFDDGYRPVRETVYATTSFEVTCVSAEDSCAPSESVADLIDLDWTAESLSNVIVGSDGVATATAAEETDVCQTAAAVREDSEIDWGYSAEFYRIPGFKDEGDGVHVVVAVALAADFPISGATEYYQYGFVFDRDGDDSNNYTPHPSYPADFFADTDRWYQLNHEPGSGWSLSAQDIVDGAPEDIVSDAVVVALDNTLTLLVPLNELGGDTATISYRFSAFRHNGTWLSGPWNGDVVPAVDDGLRSLVP